MTSTQPQTIVIRTLHTKSPSTLTVTKQENDMLDDLYGDAGGPRKRRRLTHLSNDEKLLRRKLKNRVAAQTARDRKKTLMMDLEERLTELEQENKKLAMENATLKAETGSLSQENVALKERLCATGEAPIKMETGYGSAVSTDLLPQGQTLPASYWMKTYAASMLTLSLTLLLASSHQASSKQQEQLQQFSSDPYPDLSDSPSPRGQWWGPQQQSWNPSMN